MKKTKKTQKNLEGGFKLRNHINWNIGTVIFSALFLYMFVSLIIYLTADHITSYQVTAGPLSKNETVSTLAMRQETVVNSMSGGYISYFTRNLSKVRGDGVIYGIGASGQSLSAKDLTESDLISLRSEMSRFSRYYSSGSFSSVYDFKYTLQNSLISYAGISFGSTDGTAVSNGLTLSVSPSDGVVVYSVDGLETLTEDELNPDIFEQKKHTKKNLQTESAINAGDPVYKLVDSEEWSILFPATDKQVVRLATHQKIKVKFLKDGKTETGTLSIVTVGDQRYIKIKFTSGMVRYADARYLDVELITNTKSGLKIPVSSIVKKDFYTIPSTLLTKNDNNTAGFRREIKDKDGKVTTEFLSLTVYARETPEETGEEICYLDTESLSDGDILVNPETNERYTVKKKASLEGVYCINKGYAVFRMISIIDQNEEFCIVESGTSYGISQFDYIVQSGSTVKEKEVTIK